MLWELRDDPLKILEPLRVTPHDKTFDEVEGLIDDHLLWEGDSHGIGIDDINCTLDTCLHQFLDDLILDWEFINENTSTLVTQVSDPIDGWWVNRAEREEVEELDDVM